MHISRVAISFLAVIAIIGTARGQEIFGPAAFVAPVSYELPARLQVAGPADCRLEVVSGIEKSPIDVNRIYYVPMYPSRPPILLRLTSRNNPDVRLVEKIISPRSGELLTVNFMEKPAKHCKNSMVAAPVEQLYLAGSVDVDEVVKRAKSEVRRRKSDLEKATAEWYEWRKAGAPLKHMHHKAHENEPVLERAMNEAKMVYAREESKLHIQESFVGALNGRMSPDWAAGIVRYSGDLLKAQIEVVKNAKVNMDKSIADWEAAKPKHDAEKLSPKEHELYGGRSVDEKLFLAQSELRRAITELAAAKQWADAVRAAETAKKKMEATVGDLAASATKIAEAAEAITKAADKISTAADKVAATRAKKKAEVKESVELKMTVELKKDALVEEAKKTLEAPKKEAAKEKAAPQDK